MNDSGRWRPAGKDWKCLHLYDPKQAGANLDHPGALPEQHRGNGRGVFGIQAAAKKYLIKDIKNLTMAEAAPGRCLPARPKTVYSKALINTF